MSVAITQSRVRLGLGWDRRNDGGPDFDLDAVVFLSDGDGRLENEGRIAYDGQQCGAPRPVVIYNDNITGEGEGDDEVIDIDLAELPPLITRVTIAFALNDAERNAQNLGQVAGLFIRLMTLPGEVEVARFDMPPIPTRATAAVMGELARAEGGWIFTPRNSFHEGGLDEIASRFQL